MFGLPEGNGAVLVVYGVVAAILGGLAWVVWSARRCRPVTQGQLLDCKACGESHAMVRDVVSRHGGGAAVLAFVLGIVGLGLAAVGGLGSLGACGALMSSTPTTGGALLGSTVIGAPFAGMFIGGLVLLALSSMLGSSRRIWRCTVCGCYLDRT